MRRFFVAVSIAALGMSAPALAEHPEFDPDPCSGSIGGMYVVHNDYTAIAVPRIADGMIVPIVDPATGPFYLDVREVAGPHSKYELWLYAETNGRPGPQRGGGVFAEPWTPDPCHESAEPDAQVF